MLLTGARNISSTAAFILFFSHILTHIIASFLLQATIYFSIWWFRTECIMFFVNVGIKWILTCQRNPPPSPISMACIENQSVPFTFSLDDESEKWKRLESLLEVVIVVDWKEITLFIRVSDDELTVQTAKRKWRRNKAINIDRKKIKWVFKATQKEVAMIFGGTTR